MDHHNTMYAYIFVIFVLCPWAGSEQIDQNNAIDLIAWTEEDTDLHCENDPSVNRYWKRGEEILTMANIVWTNNPRIESLNQSVILRINNVSVDDEGQYTCVINSKPIQKLDFNLQVKEFTCESPDQLINGEYKGDSSSPEADSYKVHDQIQYFCNRGYELVGEAIRTCSGPPLGWTPQEPSCEPDFIVRLQKSLAVIGNKMTAVENEINTLANKITSLENNITSLANRTKTLEDKCRSGFINLGDHCYYFSTKDMSWPDALKACQAFGSTLAYPKNSKENALLKDYLRENGRVGNWWLGGTDADEEGTWLWTHDQSTITYTDWYAGEPNNGGTGSRFNPEDCVFLGGQFQRAYQWVDAPCDMKNGFVCQ